MSYASNIQRQIKDQITFLEDTFSTQSSDKCHRAPAPGAWSAIDCICHVNLALETTLVEIQKGLDKALEKGQTPNENYRPGFMGQRFARMLAPKEGDVKRRFKTGSKYKPHVASGGEGQILEEFREKMGRLSEQVELSRQVNLNRVRIASNLSSLIRFKLGDTFHIVLAHNERHIWQARKALRLA